ncbi:hypothetical protein [Gallibacterium anatis]|uniref:hypothetical protein n=1 Tax=Gallibacterium anatis TaxID=750 RepID=UPI0038B3D6FF
MSLILIKAKSGQRIDLSKVAKKGKYVELAVAGEEYHVIDSETGKLQKIYKFPVQAVISS